MDSILKFGTIDLITLGAYFLLILIILIVYTKKEKGIENFFMAGRSIGWVAVGMSLFATNISSEHLIGLASSGTKSGLAVGNFEWSASLVLMILAWFFIPFYHKSGVFTMPEFIEKRFDNRSRQVLTTISITAYITTKVSVLLYAGGIVLEQVVGWDIYTSAMLMVTVTGLYTIIGGLRAVIYTEIFQAILIIIGGVVLTVLGVQEVGGLNEVYERTPPEFFDMLRPMDDPDLPWTGVVLGTVIIGIWYWCTDQFMVQKVLAAKNIKVAQKGALLAAYLKILPVFIFVVPGIIAYILNPELEPNNAYPYLVKRLLPVGFRGLLIASLLAALMSSLASVFASCSTLFTFDIYKKRFPDAPDFRLVNVGRLATFVLIILGILWVPFIKYFSDQLFVYIQVIQGYVAPPIAAIFIIGILSKRITASSAFIVLVFGVCAAMFRFISEIMVKSTDIHIPFIIKYIAEINFLHFSTIFFLICIALLFIISSFGKAPLKEKTIGLTISTEGTRAHLKTLFKDSKVFISLNILLLFILIGLWTTFS